MTDAPSGPLSGVTVLDLSRVLAGPWCTQLLGDLGADVIKVERPGAGDDTRGWGPPFAQAAGGGPGEAAYFLCANRNKRSLAIDIAEPEGAAIIRRLAEGVDVVVENFKTGGLAKYGLDYPALSAANPRLVYCSVTGFGQTGPYAHRPGYDYMIQAMGGLMSITGQPDGTPGGEPMKVGVAVADLFSGLYASNAILAALFHARATGQGQHLDIALMDVQAAMLANQASNFFVAGEAPVRLGNAHPNLAPYQPFATADRPVVIAVGNDGQFRALCRALGSESLAEDAAFATNAQRVARREALAARLSGLTLQLSSDDLMARLEAAGVPCGPVNDVGQVFADPHVKARGLQVHQTRGDLAGPVTTVASPIRMSATPVDYRRPPPSLGQHTSEVLAEKLALTQTQIDALFAAGVIQGA